MQDGGIIQADNKNDAAVCFVRAAGMLLCIQWIPEILLWKKNGASNSYKRQFID